MPIARANAPHRDHSATMAFRPDYLPGSQGIALLGVNFGLGAGRPGTEHAPDALRALGLGARLRRCGRDVLDKGDVDIASQRPVIGANRLGRHGGRVAGMAAAVRQGATEAFDQGRIPLVMGGDHSIAMGSVAAAKEAAILAGKALKLLWIDAHADFNTPATSPSGNLHGMALAHAHGAAELGAIGSRASEPVAGHDILIFGARDIDAGEERRLRHHGLCVMGPEAMDGLQRWLAGIDPARHHLHISFDVDVLDVALAPGVGTPVSGGLGLDAAMTMMGAIHACAALRSLDLVEVNPVLDPSGRTARIGIELVAAAFSGTARQLACVA